MFITLKHEGNILFFETNQSLPDADSERDSMNAGRPTELGARSWAVAAALFFLVVGAALGQRDATTPTQTEKELEIKKEEVKQTEIDLKKKRAELEKLKVALKYQETAHAININLQADVLFDLGKAEIRPEAEAALDKVGAVIQQFPNSKVWIDGYTDSIGSQKKNLALSKERAGAVKRWLVKKRGLPARNITTEGFGEEKPVAPNINADGSDNPEGRAQNRRVQITVEK
jgi:outer membrane protein OmpA-like peptidoglycan-associated protein